ncbi:hypothetical protein K432DRAFT_400307 [Lepidopterella palustris CBS 459.81]|uniref:Uncharacterized protein n=1 Tax=Lepidopterella palustris CBS 459.81 TaxID=1314670 RepID=A0A8E2JK18_9PEZI|nr:hypothetical protein K432DRAFT_400307 [Lepidopterella palustris CBS 459.81]
MPTTAELGQLVLSYPKAKLQLALVASITTSASHELFDFPEVSLQDHLKVLTSRSAWISRGNGLNLVLQLKVEGQSLGQEDTEKLASTLSTADFWSQLHLRASLPVIHADPHATINDGSRIQLDIFHSRTNLDLQNQPSHHICFGVPFADVKPPAGTTVLALQSVHLAIEISKTKSRPQNKKQRYPDGARKHRHIESDIPGPIEYDGWFCSQEEQVSQLSPGHDDAMLLDQIDSLEGPFISLKTDDETPALFLRQSSSMSNPRKRSATLEEIDHILEQPAAIDLKSVTELVDAALRMTICKQPLKISSSIRPNKSNFVARLSEVAPSLWSPDYLPAVSQRAYLLPILSHALSHSIYSNTRSTILKSKLHRLSNRRDYQWEQQHEQLSKTIMDSSNADRRNRLISAELWHFLQSALFDPSAARRLKPLKQPGDEVEAFPETDKLLTEQIPPTQVLGFDFFSDDEDLVDFNDGFCNDDSDTDIFVDSIEDSLTNLKVEPLGGHDVDSGCVDEVLLHYRDADAVTLQHCNAAKLFTVNLPERTCGNVSLDSGDKKSEFLCHTPVDCATHKNCCDGIVEAFEPLEDARGRPGTHVDMLCSEVQHGEQLLEEYEQQLLHAPRPCLVRNDAESMLIMGHPNFNMADAEDLILGF